MGPCGVLLEVIAACVWHHCRIHNVEFAHSPSVESVFLKQSGEKVVAAYLDVAVAKP